jgi:hypothetical protein
MNTLNRDFLVKKIRNICSNARFRKSKGNDALFCKEAHGENLPGSPQFVGINLEEVCIATEFYPISYVEYRSIIITEQMKQCPYRKTRGK